MVKGRIKEKLYSGRSPIDCGNLGKTFLGGESIYKPGLLDVIASMKGFKELEEAKNRVNIDSAGNYRYHPSNEYLHTVAIIKLRIKFNCKSDGNPENERSIGKG